MILDTIQQLEKYQSLHPLFKKAAEFLNTQPLDSLSEGVHMILDKKLYAIVERNSGKKKEEAKLEAHNRYIDIQVVLQGKETMGWRIRKNCHSPVSPYNKEKDIIFFTDTPQTWVSVPPQHAVIFFPEDAHAPMVASGEVHKIILKVLL